VITGITKQHVPGGQLFQHLSVDGVVIACAQDTLVIIVVQCGVGINAKRLIEAGAVDDDPIVIDRRTKMLKIILLDTCPAAPVFGRPTRG